MEKIEQEIGCKIPLGAGSEVDKVGKKILKEKGSRLKKKICQISL